MTNASCQAGKRAGGLAHGVLAVSSLVARLERGLVGCFVALILLLILLNVVTRTLGQPLIWVDEAAISLMVVICFVGTSLTVRQRLDFAMTLLPDLLAARPRRVLDRILSGIGLAYAGFLLWSCWRLFDPLGVWRHGFDIAAFTGATLNFVYTEPTQTLGLPRWVLYLVLPVYAVGLTIHGLANLCEDLGWAVRDPAASSLGASREAG